MPTLTEAQQRDLLAYVLGFDILAAGKLSAAARKAIFTTIRAGGAAVGRGALRVPGLTGRGLGVLGAAGVGLAREGRIAAAASPVSAAAALALLGYHHRDELAAGARAVEAQFADTEPAGFREALIGREGIAFGKAAKRKVSKANKAVKEGMKWLKKGSKKITGAAPGTLPARGFITATKAAGLANPKTKSKPKKVNTPVNRLARYLKKWW